MSAHRPTRLMVASTFAFILAAVFAAQAQQGGLFPKTRARVAAMEVLDRIYSRLHWDKSLTGSSIEVVEERGGITILRGIVADSMAKVRAVDLARNTIGVTQVVDELSVRGIQDPSLPAPVVRPSR